MTKRRKKRANPARRNAERNETVWPTPATQADRGGTGGPFRDVLRRLPPGAAEAALGMLGNALGIDGTPMLVAGALRAAARLAPRLPALEDQEEGYAEAHKPSVGGTGCADDCAAHPPHVPEPMFKPARYSELVKVVRSRLERMVALMDAHDEPDRAARKKMGALAHELMEYLAKWEVDDPSPAPGRDAAPTATAHQEGCRLALALGPVPVACEHGRDVCPTCDVCTCNPTQTQGETR